MNAMAKKTPPAKALAIPMTLGDSLHELDQVGIIPVHSPSKKVITQKIILVHRTLVGSSADVSDEASLINMSYS